MALLPGSTVVLRLANGVAPETSLTIEGLRLTSLKICNEPAELSTLAEGGWRNLLSGSGQRRLEIAARGLFLGGAGELRLRDLALTGEATTYEVTLEQGRHLHGPFVISSLGYDGPHDEELSYSLVLLSSGAIALS